MKIQKLNNWIRSQKKINKMKIKKISFESTNNWGINSLEIFNKKKKIFFNKSLSIQKPR